MTARLDPAHLSAPLFKSFLAFSQSLDTGSSERALRDLINVRVSQINGCAFCLDMHVKEATIGGERPLRLHHVAIWRESGLFAARERAALEWAEALTTLGAHGVPDAVYDAVRAEFSEREISDLSFAVMAINGWNRLSIAFRAEPGSADAAYGLGKAGLR